MAEYSNSIESIVESCTLKISSSSIMPWPFEFDNSESLKRIVLYIFLHTFALLLSADPVWSKPYEIHQQEGTNIECFLSDDEFFNWIHDAKGYSIIKSLGGCYYYAERVEGKIEASEHRVTQTRAAITGLEKAVLT